MATERYQVAWAAYQSAIAGLYQRPVDAVERGEGDVVTTPDIEQRAQAVVDSSDVFGQAAGDALASDVADQRELAELQLMAGAALDLSLANDLARRATGEVHSDVAERSPTLPGTYAQVRSILSVPPSAGIRAALADELSERGASSSNPQAAKQALHAAIEGGLSDIPSDAAEISRQCVVGLAEMALPQLHDAINAVVHELLGQLSGRVSWLLHKAAELVVQAFQKILQIIGKDAQDSARQKAAEWFDNLKSNSAAPMIAGFLKGLYETERIQLETTQQIDNAPANLPTSALDEATKQVTDLGTKFRKQKDVITLVLHGIGWARSWVMGIPPWGPIALAALYLSTLGYAVYAGGDYVDWFRPYRLELVPGIRAVVARALAE